MLQEIKLRLSFGVPLDARCDLDLTGNSESAEHSGPKAQTLVVTKFGVLWGHRNEDHHEKQPQEGHQGHLCQGRALHLQRRSKTGLLYHCNSETPK